MTVIRSEFWEREYGGEGDPLGAVLILDGEPHEVVGVLPDGLQRPVRGRPTSGCL